MRTFFTADYHLGHENIIRYCGRPFKNVGEMNSHIMLNHNSRVKPEDVVYFLGDFCFRNSPGGKAGEGAIHKADYYRKQLNGLVVYIKGNHDRNNSLKTNIERVIIRYGGEQICMVHNPIHIDYNYRLNFVGHVHNHWKFKRMYNNDKTTDVINVGVDVWGFKPVTYEEIMKEYTAWTKMSSANQLESQKKLTSQGSRQKSDVKNSAKT
jgi:calcineurin-like phosphoesterase family protein